MAKLFVECITFSALAKILVCSSVFSHFSYLSSGDNVF